MSKIVVGMSGGVDSAVVAQLLKNEGHDVSGVFMRNWDSAANNDVLGNPNAQASVCPEEQDWIDVQKLAKQIGIKVQRVDFVNDYWDQVFTNLIKEYKAGRTPNPDLLCNRYIKFGAFINWVNDNVKDVDYIATGHYALIENGVLKKPRDAWKDQTYFLAQVKKEVLPQIMFPLAHLQKDAVRKIAKDFKLAVANKKDSTGICFIGERDFTQFLQNYIPAQPGEVIDVTNNQKIGKHVGAMYYTIGQRKGLHLGGMQEPYYVAYHDMAKKIIYAAPQSNKTFLISSKADIKKLNWFANKKEAKKNVEVKFRYKSQAVKCNIEWTSENALVVQYAAGFEAVTPGQQAVFYEGNICLGGGIIEKVYLNSGKIIK